MASFLSEYPPFKLEITLYGATPETYEAVTRLPGSFERCWSGIRALVRRGIPVELKAALIEQNRGELDLMRRQAEDVHPNFHFDSVIMPRFDGGKQNIACRIPPAELVAMDAGDGKKTQAWGALEEEHNFNEAPAPAKKQLFHCGAGTNSFNIDPYGQVGVCDGVVWSKVSLRTKPFLAAWREDMRRHRFQELPADSPCGVCEIAHFCDNCPAWRSLEGVGLGDPVPYLCELAKERNARFGDPSQRCGVDITGWKPRPKREQVWEVI